VQVSSTYRRLQRFFQFADLAADRAAPVVAVLLRLDGPLTLVLDRTNWKVGRREINLLVLAVTTRRHRVALMWTVLDLSDPTRHSVRDPHARRPARHHRRGPDRQPRPPARRARRTARGRRHPRRHGPRRRARTRRRRSRRAPQGSRAGHRRHQPPGRPRARRLPQAMGHRVLLRRRQDPGPQPRGHPASPARGRSPSSSPSSSSPSPGPAPSPSGCSGVAPCPGRRMAIRRSPSSASASSTSEGKSEVDPHTSPRPVGRSRKNSQRG